MRGGGYAGGVCGEGEIMSHFVFKKLLIIEMKRRGANLAQNSIPVQISKSTKQTLANDSHFLRIIL